MNLLLISQYFPPEIGAGATRSESLVRYLREKGWEIEVISELPNYPTGIIPANYRHSFHQKEEYCGSTIHRLWVWANSRSSNIQKMGLFLTFLWSSLLYILFHPKKYDLVYASSPPIFAAVAGCLIAKILRTRFVLEIRDIWPDAAVDIGSVDRDSLFFKIASIIEHWLYKQADLIIPVTEAAETIIKHRSPETKTQVVFNGVDLENFHRIDNPMDFVEESYDSDKFRIGYVGSLGVIHDMKTVVEAAKLCEDDPEIEFIVVGDGSQRNKFLNYVNEVKPVNLKWLGLKPHELIPAYISSFDVALNPVYDHATFESIITVKFYEYLACGVPVISTARGQLQKEGILSGAITIDPGEPRKLACKIIELKNDPQKLTEMRKKAPEYIKKFTRRSMTFKLSDILTELINPRTE